jgi:phage minor structural protein
VTKVYDKQMNFLAELENATAINVSTPTNELWKAGFTLPYDDPDTQYCKPFNRVRLYDNTGDEIGLFRIMKNKIVKDGEKLWEFKLEHVLATLIDPSIPGYYQTVNQTTRYNIEFLLSFQHQEDWVAGKIDFERMFWYKYENENGIYNALQAVPKPFDEPYLWTFDTSTYPWTLNLVQPSVEPVARIRAGYNMKGITKDEDPTKVITRIYALGYGEGINQLSLKDYTGDKDYIEAEQDLIDKYGIVDYIKVDRRYENAESLYAYAKSILNEYKIPPVTYKIDAADVYQITGLPIDKFSSGDIVRVTDTDLNLDFDARIMKVNKPDIKGQPGNVGLEINRKVMDIGDQQNEAREKARINDVYAMGSGSIDSNDYADNCDGTHPAKIISFIHGDVVNVNEMLLTYETEAFRAYSQATEGGGGQTTSAGGGQTTSAGGGQTTTSTADHSHKMFHLYDSTGVQDPGTFYGYYGRDNAGAELSGYLPWYPAHIYTFSADGAHAHSVSDHQHSVDDHSHTVSDHQHSVLHGIYELGTLPTGVTVTVDGNEVTGLGLNETNVNIVPYLSKDSSGRIERNKNHVIEITPNGLGRISATVVKKVFSQSRGQYTA